MKKSVLSAIAAAFGLTLLCGMTVFASDLPTIELSADEVKVSVRGIDAEMVIIKRIA